MGTVWSALLVGGGLAGALFVWLLRGGAPRDEQGGAGTPKLEPSRREQVSKPEHLQESNGCLISEATGLGKPGHLQEAARKPQSPSGDGGDCVSPRKQAPSGQSPDTAPRATAEAGDSRAYAAVSRSEDLKPVRGLALPKRPETPSTAAARLKENAPSGNLQTDRAKEVSLPQPDSSALADRADWGVVSNHSLWGEAGVGEGLEAPGLSSSQAVDCDGSVLVECKEQAVAVAPGPQQVGVRFRVHYITSTGEQFVAVVGDHESLGRWTSYIPLQDSKDGFWSRSVALPADTAVQWKFVLVENGEVARWEECGNRLLETGREDKVLHQWWGIP